MNPKSFPKRLDSKTSCLRITVPENLDLALEGLIRKVLKEQPKADDVYSFAADYFETLLKIRDKAGAKFTAAQLCPFHSDEEAREMIILAGTFSKRAAESRRHVEDKRKITTIAKTKSLGRKKKVDKAVLEKPSFREGRPEKEKQTTPDLIKKLSVSGGNGPKREETETVKEENEEEEFLTSDPIKELVEKELSESVHSGSGEEGPRASDERTEPKTGPTEQKTEKDDLDGRPKSSEEKVVTPPPLPKAQKVTEKNEPGMPTGGEKDPGEVKNADEGREEQKIDAETSKAPEEVADKVAEGSEDKTADEERREPEDGRIVKEMQSKEEKENKEEAEILRKDEGPQKIESVPTKKTAAEVLGEPPTEERTKAEEKNSPATVEEIPEGGKTENLEAREEEKKVTSPEMSVQREAEMPEVEPSKDERAPDVPQRAAPSLAAQRENAERNEEKQDSREAEEDEPKDTEKEQIPKEEEKKQNELATEWTKKDESEGGETAKREENNSEIAGVPEENKPSQALAESEKGAGTVDEERLGERGKEITESEGDKTEDIKELPAKAEEKLTSADALKEQENAAEENVTNLATEPSQKSDRIEQGKEDVTGGITVSEQLPQVKNFEEVGKPEQNNGKADEEVNVKGRHPPEDVSEHSPATTEERIEAREDTPTYESAPRPADEGGEVPKDVSSTPPEEAETPAKKTEGEEEELCSVVDVLSLPKAEERVEGSPEDLGRASESQDNRDTSDTHQAPNEIDFPAEEKDKQTAVQEGEPVETENDKSTDLGEELAPDSLGPRSHEPEVTEETDSAAEKHIVIIEEPEKVPESAEESIPAAGIQIKTIQTHYYDSLRVPEILTREYRVHEVAFPVSGGGVPPAEETPQEFAESGTVESADDRRSPPTAPDGGSQTSELDLRETCRTFLSNERLFSSLGKDEIRHAAHEILDSFESVGNASGTVPPPEMEKAAEPGQLSQEKTRRDSEPDLDEPLPEAPPKERTATGEASSAETDSTASSAATEIKMSDSLSAPRPPSSRSLDLGERNPLPRSSSLSAKAADFDVWSTIERELEEAATKIQSKYRGYKTRKKLRRENAVQIPTEESSRITTPVEGEDGDDRRRGTGEFHDVIVLEDHPR